MTEQEIGCKIIDAIISGSFIKITNVPYDCPQAIMDDGSIQEAQVAPHNHLSIWSSNAAEQLGAMVRGFVQEEIRRDKWASYIFLLRSDVEDHYKEVVQGGDIDDVASVYACVLDLIDTMMRELGISHEYPLF